MDAFTITTGLASLCSFAIQIFDLFPRLGKLRQASSAFLVGVFAGSLLRAVAPASIRFDLHITGFGILVSVFGLALVGLLIAAGLTDSAEKRGDFYGAAFVGLVAYLMVLGLGSIAEAATDAGRSGSELTMRELSLLADSATQAKDPERAVIHLRAIERRLQQDEPRKKVVQARIRALELDAVR